MSKQWLDSLHENVLLRNSAQSDFLDIINIYQQLWTRNLYLENTRIEARHKVASIQKNLNNPPQNNKFNNDSILAIKNQFEELQSELVSYEMHFPPSTQFQVGKKNPSELSRLIFDQKKMLSDQASEIVTAKLELRSANSRLSEMEAEMTNLRLLCEKLTADNAALENSFHSSDTECSRLLAENELLTKRLMDEKEKSAAQMNVMNELVEGAKHE